VSYCQVIIDDGVRVFYHGRWICLPWLFKGSPPMIQVMDSERLLLQNKAGQTSR
jgi:hypothetical protein